MCLFSTHPQNTKIKKRIAQLKNELVPVSHFRSYKDSFENISDMFAPWKQKIRHALYHLNEHATQLKRKAKENPKTILALAAGMALAGFLLTRKN
ncbi:hypothetical protein [Bartonella quintana]|uniref:Uncharacterized protein n=3 Tax=Bartonella quintana TaxID=803 RepID=A0A0H3LVB0_BARQU|nr:hypothetical protein [Bartonella quintana]ETS12837.1 hypothetical protein Q651_00781 [Bartonella quintana BQ2-D70]ETS14741.1 hypothetical protein Q650_00128 [Bartonella quintana JK 73rel]ETS17174.1 hypothetical protein Q649_00129 [Bartonella quintana JK 73]ETS17269.1 hypothetical protein Q648_00986 [Bartonella quintana JK 12]ETS19467.1 hypothetical protein Q647_00128 [Bartonella quintana JK 7]